MIFFCAVVISISMLTVPSLAMKKMLSVEDTTGRDFSRLKGRFGTLMRHAKRCILDKPVDVSDLKEQLRYSHQYQISRESLREARSTEEVFDDIVSPMCSVVNYSLLPSLATELKVPKIHEEIADYEMDEEKFDANLLKQDFAIALKEELCRHQSSSSQLPVTEIILKVEWAEHKATLKEFRGLIRRVFPGLFRWINLDMVNEGCISFTCSASKGLESALVELAKEQVEEARQAGVIKLVVGSEVILDTQLQVCSN